LESRALISAPPCLPVAPEINRRRAGDMFVFSSNLQAALQEVV
jgi:hypothetical protein